MTYGENMNAKKQLVLPLTIVALLLVGVYAKRDTIRDKLNRIFAKDVEISEDMEQIAAEGIVNKDVLQTMYDSFQEIRKSDSNLNARLEQIKTLYQRDKEESVYRTISVKASDMSPSDTSYTIKEVHLTEDYDSLGIQKDVLAPFSPTLPAYDENGNKRDGWQYLVITVEIENTGDQTIPQYLDYGFAPMIYFVDDDGETYYEVTSPNYCSFQPGNTSQHAYYYSDFEPGASFENTYILTVPTDAVKDKHMVLIWNTTGKSSYPVEEFSLINLGDLQ